MSCPRLAVRVVVFSLVRILDPSGGFLVRLDLVAVQHAARELDPPQLPVFVVRQAHDIGLPVA